MPNNLKLLLILTFGIGVGSFLFYQGLVSYSNSQSKKIESVSENPLKEVLGEVTEDSQEKKSGSYNNNLPGFEKANVLRVIDGDTIEVVLEGSSNKVRLIGIDTPETVDPRRPVGCFGKEASNEAKRLIEGKTVYLEKDISETDKYNRLLRYVYLKLGDGQLLFINDYLVRQGFGFASTFPPDVKYSERLTKAQEEARENLRGLWGKC